MIKKSKGGGGGLCRNAVDHIKILTTMTQVPQPEPIVLPVTVYDKTFEGENFRGLPTIAYFRVF